MRLGRQAHAVCLVLLAAAGCAGVPHTGDLLVDARAEMLEGKPRDRVLWAYRGAAAALRTERHADAAELLDEARRDVDAVLSRRKAGADARKVFVAEKKKVFIGEPYERAMASFYRGLLYWMDGDRDNAHAAFLDAQFQDSDAEEGKYRNDFLVFELLASMVEARMGLDWRPAFARAVQLGKGRDLQLTANDDPRRDNVFLVAEYGIGPTKYATGQFGEQLRFDWPACRVGSMRITVAGKAYNLLPVDSVTWQATTRGGRVMDFVLAGKARFKAQSGAVGEALAKAAQDLSQQQYSDPNANLVNGVAGAAAGIGAIIALSIAMAANPAADTRSWDNLPRSLSATSLQLRRGRYAARSELLDGAGRVLEASARDFTLVVDDDTRDTVILLSAIL